MGGANRFWHPAEFLGNGAKNVFLEAVGMNDVCAVLFHVLTETANHTYWRFGGFVGKGNGDPGGL